MNKSVHSVATGTGERGRNKFISNSSGRKTNWNELVGINRVKNQQIELIFQ
jgi:hypothetical protein